MYTKEQIRAELDQIVSDLLPYEPKKIILFGSLARGDFHEFSDVDLLIIKDTERRFIERIEEVYELIQSKLPVEPLVYTDKEINQMIQEQNGFIEKVLKEGVVLYEQ